jgi:2-amino-4-hydroxy-6-hydroxymethyldihydropteridine diphosphokinase
MLAATHDALLGLGGNLGDVRATLRQAVARLCDGSDVTLVARSSDYATPPWGVEQQPPFVNAAVAVATRLSPHALLDRVQQVERAFGRDRDKEQRWGPRTLDIDILAYDDLAIDDGRLTLPHPRMLQRAFVLVPLAEIAPERTIGGVRISDALAMLDAGGITRLP